MFNRIESKKKRKRSILNRKPKPTRIKRTLNRPSPNRTTINFYNCIVLLIGLFMALLENLLSFFLNGKVSLQKADSSKSKLANLEDDCSVFSKLLFSIIVGNCDLQEFLDHVNQKFLPRFPKIQGWIPK